MNDRKMRFWGPSGDVRCFSHQSLEVRAGERAEVLVYPMLSPQSVYFSSMLPAGPWMVPPEEVYPQQLPPLQDGDATTNGHY